VPVIRRCLITRAYSKTQILDDYFNTVYFGRGSAGPGGRPRRAGPGPAGGGLTWAGRTSVNRAGAARVNMRAEEAL
jgi:hypothetical protein